MANLEITRVEPSELDRHVIGMMEGLAQEAWTEDLAATRTPEEVAFRFNTRPEHLEEVVPMYKGFAKHGNLVAAKYGNRLLGFALVRNDVSPRGPDLKSLAVRSAKRAAAFVLPRQSRVYAWGFHLSVRPDNWGQGIGSRLVAEGYDGQFDHSQLGSTYVFDEDDRYTFDESGDLVDGPFSPFQRPDGSLDRSLAFVEAMGFALQSHNRTVKHDYFGPGTRPVVQFRFEGPVDKILAHSRYHASRYPAPGQA